LGTDVIVTRTDLQNLARRRLREARLLLQNGLYDGAYYLFGLAIECAIKSCIARRTRRHDFPDKQVVSESHTHDLTKLMKIAGLEPALLLESAAHPLFATNWNVVKDWKVETRYLIVGQQKASDMRSAVVGKPHGVMSWIRRNW